MQKIIIGNKNENKKYLFRETCFGIVYINDEFYVTKKNNEISLIGGGIEKKESHEDTLKREFLEEAGLQINSIIPFIAIDCYWLTREKDDMNSLANFYICTIKDEILEATEKESCLIKLSKNEILSKLSLPYQIEAIKRFININK